MSIVALREIQVKIRFDSAFKKQFLESPLTFLEGFDLTEEEKQRVIIPNINWLIPHRIAGMAYPESKDAYTVLYQMGIRALVNLAESSPSYPTTAIIIKHIPVEDFVAPTLEQVIEALQFIEQCLHANQPVAVHCLAGLGRTGTILACYLVGTGISAEEAISTIRAFRPGSIETLDQENTVRDYEWLLHSSSM